MGACVQRYVYTAEELRAVAIQQQKADQGFRDVEGFLKSRIANNEPAIVDFPGAVFKTDNRLIENLGIFGIAIDSAFSGVPFTGIGQTFCGNLPSLSIHRDSQINGQEFAVAAFEVSYERQQRKAVFLYHTHQFLQIHSLFTRETTPNLRRVCSDPSDFQFLKRSADKALRPIR
jgi:hypothetical protein